MADAKISALTTATLPLAGTEVLPIVQSGTTKKVAADDLTVKNVRSNATTGILQVTGPAVGATRVMTTPDANFTTARTDAGQTFTGNQQLNGDVGINGAPISITNFTTLRVNNDTWGGRLELTRATAKHFVFSWSTGGFSVFGNATAEDISIQTGATPTEKVRIVTATGDVKVTTGNLVIGTAGQGIDFSATTEGSGTMTSELLADYEEGTWTPTQGTFTVVGTFSSTGSYTRIGRTVSVFGTLSGSTSILPAADVTFNGLPFVPTGIAFGLFMNAAGNTTGTLVVNSGGVRIIEGVAVTSIIYFSFVYTV
jgi:hypothetical protein